jgi:hypothetical protein
VSGESDADDVYAPPDGLRQVRRCPASPIAGGAGPLCKC